MSDLLTDILCAPMNPVPLDKLLSGSNRGGQRGGGGTRRRRAHRRRTHQHTHRRSRKN